MMTIGLTGWSDHDLIQREASRKLEDYSSHFPVVELDTSFYAIPSVKNMVSWIEKTPDRFTFLPKVHSMMTLHKPFAPDFESMADVYAAYLQAFDPMIREQKVKAFLFQFPPTFDCIRPNVNYLKYVKKQMNELPVAVEFRNQSWFTDQNASKTLALLKQLGFTHVVVDQPQTPTNSIPMVKVSTHPALSIMRLHGQNYEGWLGENVTDWRAERTLHDYSPTELEAFKETALQLEQCSREVCIIFNNNSGGHAAKNAKELQKLLALDFDYLGPQQLDLL